jgi:hypothetical protein
MLDDDGYPWPTATTRIELKYPTEWRWKFGFFPSSGRSMRRAPRLSASSTTSGFAASIIRTAQLLDDPTIWATIKALARFIQDNDEDHGCYGLGDGVP